MIVINQPKEDRCAHASVRPFFDQEAYEMGGLSWQQVRERWPRFQGQCPDCGENVIAYFDFAHYMAGNW